MIEEAKTTFIFIRHAEREYGLDSFDHSLTARGFERAQNLVNVLGRTKIDAIYTTPFQRTQQTVQPLAKHLKKEISIQDEMDLNIKHLTIRHSGETILICGHSFSLPRFLNELGVKDYYSVLEHGNITVVKANKKGEGKLKEKLKF